MKTIKEYNYCVKDGDIVIRSLKNSDLTFLKDWIYKDWNRWIGLNKSFGKFLEYNCSNISNQELIIEINNKPIGEISIYLDEELIKINKNYKKPYYLISIYLYDNFSDNDIKNTIKLLIKSWKIFKLRKGTVYTIIDERDEPKKKNFQNIFFENGFYDIKKDQYDYKVIFKEIAIALGVGKKSFLYNHCKIIIRKI